MIKQWTKRDKFRNWKQVQISRIFEDQADVGLGGPPNNWRSFRFTGSKRGGTTQDEWYICFGNDASQVQIGSKFYGEGERWEIFIACVDFRKMALWYLWRWAWGEWFGLRRKLFYRRLKKQVRNIPRRFA